jgi:hypothetical protein
MAISSTASSPLALDMPRESRIERTLVAQARRAAEPFDQALV